jgi:hypothetical protein
MCRGSKIATKRLSQDRITNWDSKLVATHDVTSHSISNNSPSIIFPRCDQKASQIDDVFDETVSSLKDLVCFKLVPLGKTSLDSELPLVPKNLFNVAFRYGVASSLIVSLSSNSCPVSEVLSLKFLKYHRYIVWRKRLQKQKSGDCFSITALGTQKL